MKKQKFKQKKHIRKVHPTKKSRHDLKYLLDEEMSDMKYLKLDQVNIKFRQLVDLLLYSETFNINVSEFKSLLNEQYKLNFDYLWMRFLKSSQLFWENGQNIWENRFRFLFSLKDKKLIRKINLFIMDRILNLFKTKLDINPKYDSEFAQFLSLCQIKKEKNNNFTATKYKLIKLANNTNVDKLLRILNFCIPNIFNNMEEYTNLLVTNLQHSSNYFDRLLGLESKGINFDKQPIIDLAIRFLNEKPTVKNCIGFLSFIKDDKVRSGVKHNYKTFHKFNLLKLLDTVEFLWGGQKAVHRIQHLLDLDSTLTDDLLDNYLDVIFTESSYGERYNKLLNIVRNVPQISPKKILEHLSAKNKVIDIRNWVKHYPELKQLTSFV